MLFKILLFLGIWFPNNKPKIDTTNRLVIITLSHSEQKLINDMTQEQQKEFYKYTKSIKFDHEKRTLTYNFSF